MSHAKTTIVFGYTNEFGDRFNSESNISDCIYEEIDELGMCFNTFLAQIGYVRKNDMLFMEDINEDEYDALHEFLKEYRANKNSQSDTVSDLPDGDLALSADQTMDQTIPSTTAFIETVMPINTERTNENATLPTRGSRYAAGYDLYANTEVEIKPGQTAQIKTGLRMEIPNGFFGAVFARSGMATKYGLRPANCVGIIDSDYRGEIIVALHNDSTQTRKIEHGDRIAQIIIMPTCASRIEFVEGRPLTGTLRDDGGFGSTGV